ncbi:MFS transporter [candidate division FCPU426 bacterium]|nr:MFS transporter [candidate division FCPU426 bacterium]
MSLDTRKAVLSWGLYDWANSAFSTTIMAGFFPVFFKQYWSLGVDPTLSSARLGLANASAGMLVALAAPILGAIADQGGARKKFLAAFAFLGVVMCTGLYWISRGQWTYAVLFYIAATLGFSGANIFYDALLPSVASPRRFDFVSAFGYALGYLGGGLLFAVNVAMTLKPAFFGLPDAAAAIRVSFLTVAVWWAIFSVPVFLFVQEPPQPPPAASGNALRRGWAQLLRTFQELRGAKTIFLFLLAYWFYIDGVYTMIRMAVDYGLSLGLASADLVMALLLTQFVGFPSALAFGVLAQRLDARRVIFICLGVYLCVTLWGAFLKSKNEFYLLAISIGLVQGGIQALSRSFYARLIPPEKSAEYFGFFNLVGKFAAILGPVLIGGAAVGLHALGLGSSLSSRLSILSLALLFIAGGLVFYQVREPGS